MSDNTVLGIDPGRHTRLKDDPAAERCGISVEGFKSLVYDREMPNGGYRELAIDSEGRVTLAGEGPSLDALGMEDSSYSTTTSDLDYNLDESALESYDGNYDELDEVLAEVEQEVGWNME